MKASEHLAFLQRIANQFNSIQKPGDIEKDMLDNIIFFDNIDDNLVYADLLNAPNLTILLNEYRNLISQIKNNFNNRKSIFDEFSPGDLMTDLLMPYEYSCKLAYNELLPYSHKKDFIRKRLESTGWEYDENSLEMKNLRKEEELADNDYKIYKQKQKIAEDKKLEIRKNHSYILSFKFTPFIEKLNIIENWILRLSDSNAFSQSTFKDEEAIEVAYLILVKMGFLKMVSRPDFYNQIILKKVLTLEKKQSKDKYIAYSIHKIKDFIVDNKKDFWEKLLVEYFEIRNYDKIKVINNFKTEVNKEIDLIIKNYYEIH